MFQKESLAKADERRSHDPRSPSENVSSSIHRAKRLPINGISSEFGPANHSKRFVFPHPATQWPPFFPRRDEAEPWREGVFRSEDGASIPVARNQRRRPAAVASTSGCWSSNAHNSSSVRNGFVRFMVSRCHIHSVAVTPSLGGEFAKLHRVLHLRVVPPGRRSAPAHQSTHVHRRAEDQIHKPTATFNADYESHGGKVSWNARL